MTTTPTPHKTYAEKLITRPNHQTPWLVWCRTDGCTLLERHATEAEARAAKERHQRGEGAAS